MPLAPMALAFTFQVPFRGMSIVLSFMLASSFRLAKMVCLYKCFLVCYTLVLSPLLFGARFELNLILLGLFEARFMSFHLFHRIAQAIQNEVKQSFHLPFD